MLFNKMNLRKFNRNMKNKLHIKKLENLKVK